MNSSLNSNQNVRFHMFFYRHEHFGALWTTDLPVEEMQLLWVADIPVNVSPSLRLDLLSSNLIARPILRKIGLREIFWDWSFLCQILHPGASLYSREKAGMEYDDWQALGKGACLWVSQSTSYILPWPQRPLNRNYPHSKWHIRGDSRRHWSPLTIKQKAPLSTLGPTFLAFAL